MLAHALNVIQFLVTTCIIKGKRSLMRLMTPQGKAYTTDQQQQQQQHPVDDEGGRGEEGGAAAHSQPFTSNSHLAMPMVSIPRTAIAA